MLGAEKRHSSMSCSILEAIFFTVLCVQQLQLKYYRLLIEFSVPSSHSAGAGYEFYHEALIMHLIASSFFTSRGRLCKQIPVLLQCN